MGLFMNCNQEHFALPTPWPSADVSALFLNYDTKIINIFHICKYYNKKDALKSDYFSSIPIIVLYDFACIFLINMQCRWGAF